MGKKNLLLIVPTLMCGGQERVAVNTADILSEVYEVTLVIFDGRNAAYDTPCQVIDLRIPAAYGKLNKIINVLRRAVALRKIKKERRIDFALSFGETANLANVLSGHFGNIVTSLRTFDFASNRWRNRFVYAYSDSIICCAREIQNSLLRIGPGWKEKTTYLYNPHDVDSLRQQGREPVSDYSFSENTIVTHGRLDVIKNFPRLIKAFSIVKKEIPDAQLLMIGEGDQRERLESLVRAYRLQDSVTMLGFRKNPFAYLSKSRLYVLSSYSEGFPNALIEGMVFLPVVSVDCKSGPREILSDGPSDQICIGIEEADYGILVQQEKGEPTCQISEYDQLLADAIVLLLKDEDRQQRMKNLAAQRTRMFSCERYREKLMRIIES